MPGISCCVCGSRNSDKVTLHQFPKDDERCNLWKLRCDIRLCDDVSRFRLCSKHFTPGDYIEPNAKLFGRSLMLKPHSVPTMKVPNPEAVVEPSMPGIEAEIPDPIFFHEVSTSPIPAIQEVEIVDVPDPLFVEETSTSPIPDAQEFEIVDVHPKPVPCSCTTKRRKFLAPRYIGEVTFSDFATTASARIAWRVVQEALIKEKKKTLALREENRTLQQRFNSLQDKLAEFNNSKLDSEDEFIVSISVEPEDTTK